MTYNFTAFIKAQTLIEQLIASMQWHHAKGYPTCIYKYKKSLVILSQLESKLSHLNSLIKFHEIDINSSHFTCADDEDSVDSKEGE